MSGSLQVWFAWESHLSIRLRFTHDALRVQSDADPLVGKFPKEKKLEFVVELDKSLRQFLKALLRIACEAEGNEATYRVTPRCKDDNYDGFKTGKTPKWMEDAFPAPVNDDYVARKVQARQRAKPPSKKNGQAAVDVESFRVTTMFRNVFHVTAGRCEMDLQELSLEAITFFVRPRNRASSSPPCEEDRFIQLQRSELPLLLGVLDDERQLPAFEDHLRERPENGPQDRPPGDNSPTTAGAVDSFLQRFHATEPPLVGKTWKTYQGTDVSGNPVAVRVSQKSFDSTEDQKEIVETIRQRFGESPRHENLPRMIEVLPIEDRVVVVREWVAGQTLAEWRADRYSLDEVDIARQLVEICRPLDVLHELEIWHLQVYPRHVRIDDGTTKLLDVESAPLSSAAEQAERLDAMRYMAPETLAKNRYFDSGADIYGLGAILHELVFRVAPFDADDVETLRERILSEREPDEIVKPVRFSDDSINIARRCLDREPLFRYAEAGDLIPALNAVIARPRKGFLGTPQQTGQRTPWDVVFTSKYSRNDALLGQVAEALEEFGLDVHFIDAAATDDAMIKDAIHNSRFAGIVFEDDTLAGGAESWALRQLHWARKAQKPCIGIQFGSTELPDEARHLSSVDFSSAGAFQECVQRFVRGLSVYWLVPQDNERRFFGREEDLQQIHKLLTTQGIALVSGDGGVGKTQLVIRYAHMHCDDYGKKVVFLDCSTPARLERDLAKVMERLARRGAYDEDDLPSRLAALCRQADLLLVLDDLADPELLQAVVEAPRRGKLLITSKRPFREVPEVQPAHELQPFPPDRACQFLQTRNQPVNADDELALQQVAKEAKGNPFLLDRIARIVSRNEAMSYKSLLDGGSLTDALSADSEEPLFATLVRDREELTKVSQAAAELYACCSLLSGERIPKAFVREIARCYKGPIRDAIGAEPDNFRIEQLLQKLIDFSLVHCEPGSPSFEFVHPIYQELELKALQSRSANDYQRLLEVVALAFDSLVPMPSAGSFASGEEFAPHIERFAELPGVLDLDFVPVASLLNKHASYLHRRHNRSLQAISYLHKALRVLGERPLNIERGRCLERLAYVYVSLEDLEALEPVVEDALKTAEQATEALEQAIQDESQHEDVREFLFEKLDFMFWEFPNPVPASDEYLESLRWFWDRRRLNMLDLKVSTLRAIGKLSEAKQLNKEADALRERLEEAESQDESDDADIEGMYTRASQLSSQELYDEAINLLTKCLDRRPRGRAYDNPTYSGVLRLLGYCANMVGSTPLADQAQTQASRMVSRLYGGEHSVYASVLQDIASVRAKQGLLGSADTIMDQADKVLQRLYQEDHRETVHSNVLRARLRRALIWIQADGHESAERIVRQALKAPIAAYQRSAIAATLQSLARSARDKEQVPLSLLLYDKARAMFRNVADEYPERAHRFAWAKCAEWQAIALLIWDRKPGDVTDAVNLLKKCREVYDEHAIYHQHKENAKKVLDNVKSKRVSQTTKEWLKRKYRYPLH